jgi:HK97 family phage prohead protease
MNIIYTRADAGAEVLGVDADNRIITAVVMPFGDFAAVPFRGDVWQETFERGAFDGVDAAKVRVCREHDRADTVGKVLRFHPRDPRGLVADIRIANTARGDDTLALAHEGMLSASAAFGVRPGGQILDHRNKIRRVTRAWLDHVALVMCPAYDGAEVVGARSKTPHLDAHQRDPVFAWAALRTDPVFQRARRRRPLDAQ